MPPARALSTAFSFRIRRRRMISQAPRRPPPPVSCENTNQDYDDVYRLNSNLLSYDAQKCRSAPSADSCKTYDGWATNYTVRPQARQWTMRTLRNAIGTSRASPARRLVPRFAPPQSFVTFTLTNQLEVFAQTNASGPIKIRNMTLTITPRNTAATQFRVQVTCAPTLRRPCPPTLQA